jgi:3-hydroxyisobutyrate dehydrogenase/2-hydroxy-3-oxopropionate reductase
LQEVDNPYAVGQHSDILITMVVDESQTDTVLRGDGGALSILDAGSVVIVMSTVSPEYCQALSAEALERGISVLDCPVSGGRGRAEQGQLALICGGDKEAVDRCHPVLTTMGSVHHCGEIGMGQVAKLANQALVITQFRLVEEARSMARSYGMDLEQLMGVLRQSTGTSWVIENWDVLVSLWPNLAPLAKKDVDLCVAAAKKNSVTMPILETTAELPWGGAGES